MASLSIDYAGSATSLTITLNSLASGSSAVSSTVDNTTTLYLDALVSVKLVTASSGVSATGTIDLYISGSTNNTDFEDTRNDKWVGTVVANANSLTLIRLASVSSAYGGALPPYWKLRVANNSGAALAAAGHAATFRGISAISA